MDDTVHPMNHNSTTTKFIEGEKKEYTYLLAGAADRDRPWSESK